MSLTEEAYQHFVERLEGKDMRYTSLYAGEVLDSALKRGAVTWSDVAGEYLKRVLTWGYMLTDKDLTKLKAAIVADYVARGLRQQRKAHEAKQAASGAEQAAAHQAAASAAEAAETAAPEPKPEKAKRASLHDVYDAIAGKGATTRYDLYAAAALTGLLSGATLYDSKAVAAKAHQIAARMVEARPA